MRRSSLMQSRLFILRNTELELARFGKEVVHGDYMKIVIHSKQIEVSRMARQNNGYSVVEPMICVMDNCF